MRCDFREQGPFFSKMMTKALRKCENVVQNTCGRTQNGKQSLQRGCINKKYTLFAAILQIPGAIKSPKMGVIRAIGGPGKLFRAWFRLNAVFKIMLPNEGGKLFFKKSDTKLEERGVWSMKGIKKTRNCIRISQNCKCYAYHPFCKRGLEAKTARESSHRLFLKGARSEHIANRTSNRATRASKNDKIYFFFAVWGSKK